jgi:hypothetical protein
VSELRVDEVLRDIRQQLGRANPLMETLLDLMIVSEVWSEDGVVHVLAWIPDIEEGRPRYRLKHIVYDASRRRVVRVVNAGGRGGPREAVAAPA